MKKIYLLLLILSTCGYAQVGIGTAAPTATLDIVATNPTGASTTVDGIVIPRVDRQRAQNMTGTTTSTMIFVNSILTGTAAGTAVNITSIGFYYYDGTVWQKIATGASTDWALSGNASTTPGTNFIGTTDATDLRIKTGGTDRWNISDTNSGQLQSYSLGSNTAPAYSFQGDTNTGIFSSAAENLGFVTNGTEKLRIPDANQVHAMSLGTAALPFYSFSSDPNTGIFSSAADALDFTTNGTARLRIPSANQIHALSLGTAALPFYSFSAQSTTGMFGTATDVLGFSTAGTEKARIESDGDVGIGVTPDVSAKLDVSDANKGFLPPRVALTSTTLAVPITTPATGLLVYNTAIAGVVPNNVVPGYYYNSGTTVAPVWKRFSAGNGDSWQTSGNSGTIAGTNFIGTNDAVDLRIKTGGTDRWTISDTNSGQLQSFALGSSTAPVYSFQGDTNTGLFSSGTDALDFTTNGTARFRIPSANQIHALSLGTAALPFYSFSGQSTTGMFGAATDVLGFSTAGTEKARIESDGDVGIGTTPDASAKLDVSATDKGLLAPRVALTSTIVAGPITTPATGLLVYNTNTAGTAPNNVVPGYYYNSGTTIAPVWKRFSAGNGDSWQTIGNSGTVAGTNYIGTNDVQDFVVKTSAVVNTPLERMRITTAGNVGINAPTPTTTALVTINPNTNAIRSGIDMTLTNATAAATGLNITSGNALVNGISVSNSSNSSSNSVFGIGSVLSAGTIVSGYNGYRIDALGIPANIKSYGLYGVNGVPGTYATNANTWAGFLQGRTVISSESSPTSPIGTDLEVRNTTTGAGAPATVALRQTTALATSGNVLGNLNFGDNYVTTPQAQILVQRDAAASSVTDMPTAMTFSTTPDASATLTERMRIDNAGKVGVGTTAPTTLADVNGALSLREGAALTFSNGANSNIILGTTPYSLYRITGPTGVFSLTGLVPVGTADGQIVTLINTTAFDFTIVNNATSTAANRIFCPGATDLVLSGISSTVTLMYNKSSSRWIVIANTDTPYGRNIKSVIGTTNTSTNSATFADMANMSITFTPKHNVVYLNFSAAGDMGLLAEGSYVDFRIVNVTAGTNLGGTTSLATDFDDLSGVATSWNAQFVMFPITVTAGTPTTIKIQWLRDGNALDTAYNDVVGSPNYSHRNLTIFD
ncbi:hypothetical protein QWY90_11845 [Flavobacterium paronense]|uniref:Beta strand repeat-containing protein n=1 Tax=Flavobacterium paronense TaxID=1392775 RepID=A0ABV5GDI1_9FLAO|nr:hypothetical protein [Flavobacterium paronense]MDN3677998.1 hypothetical protein [Flavobacterium paronense]